MFEIKTKNFIQSNVEFQLKDKNQELIHKLFDSMNEKTKNFQKNSKN
jgi:hypothetical protein